MARKRGVDLAQVVDAAAEVADTVGLDGLTMAAVAAALGVQSPSLYSHVDGLSGLRRAMAVEAARRLGSALADTTRGRDGIDALRAIAHAYRAFAMRHPSLYAAMLPVPQVGDEEAYAVFSAPVRVIADVLAGLGLRPAEAVPVIRSFRSALHGFVTLQAGGGFGMPDDVDDSFDVLIEVNVAGVLARSRSGQGPRGGARARQPRCQDAGD
jgi:AcrR family transcriptional regulator